MRNNGKTVPGDNTKVYIVPKIAKMYGTYYETKMINYKMKWPISVTKL